MALQKIGRLAMRVEGDKWNAYYALSDTMDGALWLGSIAMSIVQDLERKQAFMDLMKSFIDDIFADQIGERPEWPEPERAPGHERSGSA